jgi:hypothetical protein
LEVSSGLIKLRSGQSEFVQGVEHYGVTAFVARRQYGKTTTFSGIALKKMMKRKNHTVVFGSAKLNLAREVVRKEAEVIQKGIIALQQQVKAERLQVFDSETKKRPDKLIADDFADLFEAQRLEFRYYHSNSVYSRTKVVALRDDTVGETGDLMADEIGRVKNWLNVWEAIAPIVSSNPDYRLTLSTTPPPDDTHFSFEQLCPPIGTEFPINPKGNWYRTPARIMVLRVDAFDAYADGVPIYDLETRQPLDPRVDRERDPDKTAWDRNYGCKFIYGGTAACGMLQLNAAMSRGIGHCLFVLVENDDDLERAIAFMLEHIGADPVGLGLDLATTEKETSNPTALSVVTRSGFEIIAKLVLAWKTREPEVARYRVRRVVEAVNGRKAGGRARRLAIDATNERYFSMDLQKYLGGLVPVELVISSETLELPGIVEPITQKAYLGNELIDDLDDNRLTLPPERYIREDFRLVKRDRGTFDTEVDTSGRHGDTFDSTKLGRHALVSTRGGMLSTEGIRLGHNRNRMGGFRPARL